MRTAGLNAGALPAVPCPRAYDNHSDKKSAGLLAGDLVWNLLRCDNSATIVSSGTETLTANKVYTVLAVGDVVSNSGLGVITHEQDRTAGPADKVRLRFIHALSQLATLPVDVVVSGVTLVSGLQYQDASAYFPVTPDATNGVNISIQQGGVEIGNGVCVSAASARGSLRKA